MTREEAIYYLKSSGMSDEQIKSVIDAFTCENCISREKVLYMVTGGKYSDEDDEQFIDRLVNELEDMPSVTPQQTRWIPVSERLPEDHKNVLIYLSSNQITIGLYNSHRLPSMDNPIGWGADASHDWTSDEVVAWMPLPKPYEESEDKG